MRIIDQPDQRLLGGNLGDQRQHAHADHETVRRRGRQAEYRIQRLPLPGQQRADPVQERHQHAVERGEAQPKLRLQPGDSDRPHTAGRLRRVLQQTGLTDARLAEDHERPAQAPADRLHQLIQRPAITTAAHQNVRLARAPRSWRGRAPDHSSPSSCPRVMTQHERQKRNDMLNRIRLARRIRPPHSNNG